MNKTFTGKEDFQDQLGVSGYLFLHQEVLRKREQKQKPGEAALKRLKEAFTTEENINKMQTLKDIEELIYVMINNPLENPSEPLNVSVDSEASYQSLSEKIRGMIRHDRGFSIVNSSDSGGIPSPIRESESFKKLFEYKESEATSEFNSRKVKKIEFSDTMTKENGHKTKSKKNEKDKGNANFTHSSIDKMVFDDTEEIDSKLDANLTGMGDGSIAETVKMKQRHKDDTSALGSPTKEPVENEQSFEHPEELSQEFKKYSLRSSIDEKFFEMMNNKEIDYQDLNLPSINNSIIEYPQTRPSGRHMYENTDIQNQDSVSHKEMSNFKMKKNQEEKNEKKATKKEFEPKQKGSKSPELNQEEIDRNSTVKKVDLNNAFTKSVQPEPPVKERQAYKSLVKNYIPKGTYLIY